MLGSKLAHFLRNYREIRKVTSEDFANKLQLSRQTISKWENDGAGGCTLNELDRISKRLGTDPAVILGMNEPGDAAKKLDEVAEVMEMLAIAAKHPDHWSFVVDSLRALQEARSKDLKPKK